MAHYRTKRIPCHACEFMREGYRCRECGGKGYIVLRGVICNGEECSDPMTGGWECNECGNGGPW